MPASGQALVRVSEQPRAVVAILNQAGRNHRPLTSIGSRRLLAIPELGLRNIYDLVRE
jgi:hypothetical protein